MKKARVEHLIRTRARARAGVPPATATTASGTCSPPAASSTTSCPGTSSRARSACSSRLNRTGAQFTALRYFALDGTGHPGHKAQASMIRRYIIGRDSRATGPRLRKVIARASVA